MIVKQIVLISTLENVSGIVRRLKILMLGCKWLTIIQLIICFQVEDECGNIPMVLVQNKIDLIDQALVKV